MPMWLKMGVAGLIGWLIGAGHMVHLLHQFGVMLARL